MKLWVDDERPAPEGWEQARTLSEALLILYSMGDVIECIALDHDLGHPHYRDADLIANLIEGLASLGVLKRMEWKILTSNPDGQKKIRAAFESADKAWDMWEKIYGKE
jgi:hypothetical protein